MPRCRLAAITIAVVLYLTLSCLATSRVKIRGYITDLPDQHSVKILDDVISVDSATEVSVQKCEVAASGVASLSIGLLIEAEGIWTNHHQFSASRIVCDANQFDREIGESAFLQEEPVEAEKTTEGTPIRLKTDGELLLLDERTRRVWDTRPAQIQAEDSAYSSEARLVGWQVRYRGVRRPDGSIAASVVELGPPAPADAFKSPGGIGVYPSKDPKTGVAILEFRKGEKIHGRMKLFDVKEVQEYVKRLGRSLLPSSADRTARPIEFRFFVVEDPTVNATALPDGTVLVNTGLLGAVENESQLAFVLSHEIAHVLQAHYWREVSETRSKRVLITIGAIAGSYYVRDVALYLGQLGLEMVVNGYSRRIENQADRLGLQNIIDHGYDPRPGLGLFHTFVERYAQRSTSVVWSNHDSSLMRGSFLTVQLARQYPQERFDGMTIDTAGFRAMRGAMGPVKVM